MKYEVKYYQSEESYLVRFPCYIETLQGEEHFIISLANTRLKDNHWYKYDYKEIK